MRSDLTQAQSIAAGLEIEEDSENDSSSPQPAAEPDLSGEEASKIRHDEPITLGTVIRSLSMANEHGQHGKRNALPESTD